MPDMPDMPDIKAPKMPTMGDLKKMKLPSLPKRKERVEGGPYGRIQMHGCTVAQDGKTLKLTHCQHTKIYKDATEQKDDDKLTLTFDSEEDAYSFLVSMEYGGATRA